MLIQVGSCGRHRKGRFVSILTCQSHRAGECNPSAPPFSQLSAIPAPSGARSVDVPGFEWCLDGFRVSIDPETTFVPTGAATYLGHRDNVTEVIMI